MVMIALTDEEVREAKKRQIAKAAQAVRMVVRAYPGTDPWALTDVLAWAGSDYGLIEDTDWAEVRIQAAE